MVTGATNLGRSGLYDWIVQRATAVLMAVYTVVMLGFFLYQSSELTYQVWVSFIGSLPMRIFTVLILFSAIAHAWVGLWTVATDYLTVRQLGSSGTVLRLLFLAACALLGAVYLIWGVMILWGAV